MINISAYFGWSTCVWVLLMMSYVWDRIWFAYSKVDVISG